jgi:hypothetical protein
MGNGMVIGMGFLTLIEPIFRIICYIAVTVFAYKGIEALNIYIRKSS